MTFVTELRSEAEIERSVSSFLGALTKLKVNPDSIFILTHAPPSHDSDLEALNVRVLL